MSDFDRTEAEDLLFEKMVAELSAFRDSLLKLTPAEIIGDTIPYELVYKEDLLICFENDDLNLRDADIQFLLGMDAPLEWLYQSWLDTDGSHMDMIRDFIRTTVQTQEV